MDASGIIKLRNWVAKHAKRSGAGAHGDGDRRCIQKRKSKHKRRVEESWRENRY